MFKAKRVLPRTVARCLGGFPGLAMCPLGGKYSAYFNTSLERD